MGRGQKQAQQQLISKCCIPVSYYTTYEYVNVDHLFACCVFRKPRHCITRLLHYASTAMQYCTVSPLNPFVSPLDLNRRPALLYIISNYSILFYINTCVRPLYIHGPMRTYYTHRTQYPMYVYNILYISVTSIQILSLGYFTHFL